MPIPHLFYNYSTALNISAIILSGGGDIKSNNISKDQHDSKRESVEEALIKFSIKENIPLIRICRGKNFVIHKESNLLKIK